VRNHPLALVCSRPDSHRCRGRLRYRKFMPLVAGYYSPSVPPPNDGNNNGFTPLYDTIVSSRNCHRSHLSPFPLSCKHTAAHFPPVNSSALSIRSTPFLFYHPARCGPFLPRSRALQPRLIAVIKRNELSEL